MFPHTCYLIHHLILLLVGRVIAVSLIIYERIPNKGVRFFFIDCILKNFSGLYILKLQGYMSVVE